MKYTVCTTIWVLSYCTVEPKIISDEFIKSINSNQTTWTAGQNFHPDTPIEYLRQLNGARHDPDFYNNLEVKVHNITAEEIPENFDSRSYWPECESLTSIRNQGACGSCWAFGAASAMTDRFCIATNGTTKFQFSPQDLLSCCTDCGDGCDGGYASRAWSFWVDHGIVSGGDYNSSEGCQPYTSDPFENRTTPQCIMTCQNSDYNTSYTEDKHYGSTNYRINEDVEQIQAEIMTNGPVQASYAVYDDFYNYKSGVYQHTTGEESGHHAVKIIGWGTENGTPYWLIANSWGTHWGESGFFKMLRGSNHCGIEQNILGGEPQVS